MEGPRGLPFSSTESKEPLFLGIFFERLGGFHERTGGLE